MLQAFLGFTHSELIVRKRRISKGQEDRIPAVEAGAKTIL